MKSKIRFGLSILMLGLFFSACDELSVVSYEVAPGKVSVEVWPTDNADSLYVFDSTGIDITTELSEFGIDKSIIKKAKVKKITFTLVSPEAGNFNWADHGKVSINADGLPELVIGEIGSIPTDVTEVVVHVNSEDLSDYLKSPTFDMRVEAKNKEIITEIQMVDVDVKYIVNI